MTYDWYETWADESPAIPYVLFVLPDPEVAGGILIVDPIESHKVVFKAPDYEAAQMWLLEDEFTRVEGRMSPETADSSATSSNHATIETGAAQ